MARPRVPLAFQRLLTRLKAGYGPGVWLALVPGLLYLVSSWPYWTDVASLDPLLVYNASSRFAEGGLADLIKVANGSTHPPGVFGLYVLAFQLFGKGQAAIATIGLGVMLAETLTTYALVRRLWGETAGGLAALFLGCHAMVQVHTFYLGWESLMVPLLIVALCGYVYGRTGWLATALVLLPMCKETGLVYGPAFALLVGVEGWRCRRGWRSTLGTMALLVLPPLVAFKVWQLVLQQYGATEWREVIFDRSYGSALMTVVGYALAGKTFNIFLAQNCFNAFVMNFQWLFTGAAVLLLAASRRSVDSAEKRRLLAGLILVQVPYVLFAFSFPTWTIPRYAVAVAPTVMVTLGIFLAQVPDWRVRAGLATVLVTALALSNFSSLDPLTTMGRQFTVWGEDLYNLDRGLRGEDVAVYNRQFVAAVSREDAFLAKVYESDADILVSDCQRFRLALKMSLAAAHPDYYPAWPRLRRMRCLHANEVRSKEVLRKVLDGAKVALSRADAIDLEPLLKPRVKALIVID